MSQSLTSRMLRPDTLVACALIVVAAGFLAMALELKMQVAMMPIAVLVGLIGLGVALLFSDQRKASAEIAPKKMTQSPHRVLGAFGLIVIFFAAVHFAGFYPSIAVFVPLSAWLFGYRDPRGLVIATAIVLAGIYAIFTLAMAQEFPTGIFWSN